MRRSLKVFKRRFKKVPPKTYTIYLKAMEEGFNRNMRLYDKEQFQEMLKNIPPDFTTIAAEHIKQSMEVSKLCSCSCSFKVRPKFPEIDRSKFVSGCREIKISGDFKVDREAIDRIKAKMIDGSVRLPDTKGDFLSMLCPDDAPTYYSNAEWTKIGSTSDRNMSEEQARSICAGLMKIRGTNACPIRGECLRAWVTVGEPAHQ